MTHGILESLSIRLAAWRDSPVRTIQGKSKKLVSLYAKSAKRVRKQDPLKSSAPQLVALSVRVAFLSKRMTRDSISFFS